MCLCVCVKGVGWVSTAGGCGCGGGRPLGPPPPGGQDAATAPGVCTTTHSQGRANLPRAVQNEVLRVHEPHRRHGGVLAAPRQEHLPPMPSQARRSNGSTRSAGNFPTTAWLLHTSDTHAARARTHAQGQTRRGRNTTRRTPWSSRSCPGGSCPPGCRLSPRCCPCRPRHRRPPRQRPEPGTAPASAACR